MELDPISIKPFFKAYKIKRKEQSDIANIDAWKSGFYMCDAISACFSSGKHKYPQQPIEFFAKEELPLSENGNVNSDAVKFSAWTKMFNQGFIQKQPMVNEPQ